MSQTPFVVYDASGRIVRSGTCRADDVVHQPMDPSEFVLETAEFVDPRVNWMVADVVTARATTSVAATSVGRVITLTGVPLGADVNIGGAAYQSITMDDASGTIAITVPVGGQYSISVDAFPTLPYYATVTVP